MRKPKKLGIRGQAAIGSSLLMAALCAAPAFAADSPIAKAARSDDLATVKQLIGSRADVNLPATDGSTALLWAAYNSDLEMVKALTAAHANANVANKYGVTPLIQASRTGDAAIIKALLDGGADVALAHPEGETPLMAAAQAGDVEAVQLLLAERCKGECPGVVSTADRADVGRRRGPHGRGRRAVEGRRGSEPPGARQPASTIARTPTIRPAASPR